MSLETTRMNTTDFNGMVLVVVVVKWYSRAEVVG